MGTGGPEKRETYTGGQNRQRALLVCSQPEDVDVERETPKRKRALNTCGHQGGEGGGTLIQQRALPSFIHRLEGDTLTRQRDPPALSQGIEEGERSPTQQRALTVRIHRREGKPQQGSALPHRASRGRGRGVPPPSRNTRSSCKVCRIGRGGGKP